VPVCTWQRHGDLAAGGQGAPITPLADWVLYRSSDPRIVLNLGGFANITLLPEASASVDRIHGSDVCPCNQWLDRLAQRRLDSAFDPDGAAAARGTIDARCATAMADALQSRRVPGMAMGQQDLHLDVLTPLEALSPDDAAATLTDAIGRLIAAATASADAGTITLAGGGVHHGPLCAAIERHTGRSTAILPDAPWREGAALAVLALLELDGVPPTLSQVTSRSTHGPLPGSAWMRPIQSP
ncbi:MAG: anhydro-N-acetylmuramic acid kinase, partial [Phycisphaerales bacterium]|nr:anhydro-N-acetylmuramic acid kinase [Phycisphaerales bacterium]